MADSFSLIMKHESSDSGNIKCSEWEKIKKNLHLDIA